MCWGRGGESSSDSTSSSSLSGSFSALSLVHDGEVATHRRIGRPPPDHYPAPMRACHTGPRPDCYWPTLDTCSAHLQARGKGQRRAARHSRGLGERVRLQSAMLENHCDLCQSLHQFSHNFLFIYNLLLMIIILHPT